MNEILSKVSRYGKLMVTPIGKTETKENSAQIPVVHPQLCVSVDHFNGNEPLPDKRYRPGHEEQAAYQGAPRVVFSDVKG